MAGALSHQLVREGSLQVDKIGVPLVRLPRCISSGAPASMLSDPLPILRHSHGRRIQHDEGLQAVIGQHGLAFQFFPGEDRVRFDGLPGRSHRAG